ncbi:adenine specific DNA methylase Mod [Anopheles sinensis]|uniref:Adenine specific DNA methylase Mod n=1 Tax=Anopheles sinensis TaxID=74873 RepID=A0A084VM45_ANOSI|nr:adenine specific DNA methylase Mod [Anopheles sinensis]
MRASKYYKPLSSSSKSNEPNLSSPHTNFRDRFSTAGATVKSKRITEDAFPPKQKSQGRERGREKLHDGEVQFHQPRALTEGKRISQRPGGKNEQPIFAGRTGDFPDGMGKQTV